MSGDPPRTSCKRWRHEGLPFGWGLLDPFLKETGEDDVQFVRKAYIRLSSLSMGTNDA